MIVIALTKAVRSLTRLKKLFSSIVARRSLKVVVVLALVRSLLLAITRGRSDVDLAKPTKSPKLFERLPTQRASPWLPSLFARIRSRMKSSVNTVEVESFCARHLLELGSLLVAGFVPSLKQPGSRTCLPNLLVPITTPMSSRQPSKPSSLCARKIKFWPCAALKPPLRKWQLPNLYSHATSHHEAPSGLSSSHQTPRYWRKQRPRQD